jgi:hypothetical protein
MTPHAGPYSKMELANDLQCLHDMATSSPRDLKIWYENARNVHERLMKSSESDLGPVPEMVWHYLSDADIRLKDIAYREVQDEEIVKIISSLRIA